MVNTFYEVWRTYWLIIHIFFFRFWSAGQGDFWDQKRTETQNNAAPRPRTQRQSQGISLEPFDERGNAGCRTNDIVTSVRYKDGVTVLTNNHTIICTELDLCRKLLYNMHATGCVLTPFHLKSKNIKTRCRFYLLNLYMDTILHFFWNVKP